MSQPAQEQCIKAVSRLFLFKGSRRETIRRDHVLDTLGALDVSYKKVANVALAKAQHQLLTNTGYALVHTDAILGMPKAEVGAKAAANAEYMLTNSLKQPQLLRIVADANVFQGYPGFVALVLLAVFTAPQRKMKVRDIHARVRLVDLEVPDTLRSGSGEKGKTNPMQGFDHDFLGLLAQMKKERYIVPDKEADKGGAVAGAAASAESVSGDAGAHTYTLGPRFYLDIGKKQLLRSYFAANDQPEDAKMMQELDDEIARALQSGFAGAEEEGA
jgi:hypothetical protein